jgi:hypothetical protein
VDNGWLSLTVVDPEQEHRAFEYEGDLVWTAAPDRPTDGTGPEPGAEPESPVARSVADD